MLTRCDRLLIKEIQVFKSEIFTFLKQDWGDAISRAAALWAPRVRESMIGRAHAGVVPRPPLPDAVDESLFPANSGGECVLVNEQEVMQLWLPGRIVHIFSRRGLYDAMAVPRSFPDLRKIVVQGNIFRDHSSVSIFDAVLEVVKIFLFLNFAVE